MQNTKTKTGLVKFDSPELMAIEPSKAKHITETFVPMSKMVSGIEGDFSKIIEQAEKGITKEVIARARRLRLDIVKVRTATGRAKDALKEGLKREDKAIMGVHNILVWAVKDKEEKLLEIEKHFERIEQQRLEALQAERVKMLSQYVEDAHERKLSDMDLDVWLPYLGAKKKEHDDRIEAEKQAELARQEAERIRKIHNLRFAQAVPYYDFYKGDINSLGEMEEEEFQSLLIEAKEGKAEHEAKQARIRAEKEKAEKEKQALEKKLEAERKAAEENARKEREAAEEKLEAERKERERIEAELKAKQEAERKAAEEKKVEEQRKLQRGDDEKAEDMLKALYKVNSFVFKSEKHSKAYVVLCEKITAAIKEYKMAIETGE